jgi:hypothetical protein
MIYLGLERALIRRVEHCEVKPISTGYESQQEISYLGQPMVAGPISGKREEQEVGSLVVYWLGIISEFDCG